MQLILLAAAVLPFAQAFMFNFQQQQQHQEEPEISYEARFLNDKCAGYLCPDTLECVGKAQDCSCKFPQSQLRCELPQGGYVCISQPATHDPELRAKYASPSGNKVQVEGMRDCGWVRSALA